MESTGLGSRLYLFRLRKNIFKPKTRPKITLINSKISNFEQNNHKSYLRRSNTSVSSPPSSWSYHPQCFVMCLMFNILYEKLTTNDELKCQIITIKTNGDIQKNMNKYCRSILIEFYFFIVHWFRTLVIEEIKLLNEQSTG